MFWWPRCSQVGKVDSIWEWHLIEVEKERWTECLVSRVELVDKIAWMDMVVADMAVGGRELCHGSGGNC